MEPHFSVVAKVVVVLFEDNHSDVGRSCWERGKRERERV